MSSQAQSGPKWRNNPFIRNDTSTVTTTATTPLSSGHARAKSAVVSGSPRLHAQASRGLKQELGDLQSLQRSNSTRYRSDSIRSSVLAGGTFTPTFIKSQAEQVETERVRGIEGENDFSGKRYVWLHDEENAFVKGWVVEDREGGMLLVQCDDDTQREVQEDGVDKVNPAKFDKADDMAELTHLNEASVVHNLRMRYQADLIYTYSGLFLVTVNPYCPLPIYGRDYVNMYRGRSREDAKPHIFSMADEAFRNLVEEGQNQSILVTGESGAGKTENTKKVIQYLAAVATSDQLRAAKSSPQQRSNLSEQILRANPILEAFGNAQTVRNNNSSRFGKFIRIEFTRSGQIAGAHIDWYLLEKSRVVRLHTKERSYHIFYQLLRGADEETRRACLLGDADVEDFDYTRQGNDTVSGVSDQDEWRALLDAFRIMQFSHTEQTAILRTVAAVLHLGNISVGQESSRTEQAVLSSAAEQQCGIVCQLLGVETTSFIEALLHPRVKAGHEWVRKAQTPEQVRLALDALAKGIYERGFGDLVSRINNQLDQTNSAAEDTSFIGVLDIAGFEIFEHNSFEQLCINYTNEKLQQFFNHHMFVLEQEEYAREQIQWNFIDFGKDLQPTIDLIELSNPIGIFSCLDEDSVMPKATDKSFTDKLHGLWERKTPKYRRSLLQDGFMLTHYAAEVEYSTEGWLDKNKDPLNDNVTRLLSASTDEHVANLFSDCASSNDDDTAPARRNRVKKGLFRTVAQRHKEQLMTLMNQLHATHPHFVRCILPNHKKKPKHFQAPLVLDQLRCNGVLEGIRIARTGFPNRLLFAEFRSRYEVLCSDMPRGYLEGQVAANIMLEKLNMDRAYYRVGLTKVFFRAGVLAELEERRDALISDIMARFQSIARGYVRRRQANKHLYKAEAARIIHHNFQVYLSLQNNPWFVLLMKMRPLLGATRQAAETKKRDEAMKALEAKIHAEAQERQRIEEERRRAESEAQKVQQILESERALALDKEEIFRRLQDREASLADELAGALRDQEKMEDELEVMVLSVKRHEEQAGSYRHELEQAGTIVSQLEDEKKTLLREMEECEKRANELEKAGTQRSDAEEALNQELRILKSQLALKDRKVQDLETKLVKNDQDLEVKLANATKDLSASQKRNKELLEENRQVRQQIANLSNTSTSFEDLIRQKESELAVVRSEMKKFTADRQTFDAEKRTLASKHDQVQSQFREAQGRLDALLAQNTQLQQEASAAQKSLEDRVSDAEALKTLELQLKSVKTQLFEAQSELNREKQSRDDVQLLGEHKFKDLKRDFDALNESKITIEKEMYSQQDAIRRHVEHRNVAERERLEHQNELRGLREKHLALQERMLSAENSAELKALRATSERQADVKKDLEASLQRLDQAQAENDDLKRKIQELTNLMNESENFKIRHDKDKERIERELVTVKGRLTASENDNRALLNKIQQKNLDIARSNSRAGENQRTRLAQLIAEKQKFESDNKELQRQVEDSKITITSLEKQKQKLALSLEDVNHDISREHKTTRSAEASASAANLQLAEANRKLEIERQMRSQTQLNSKTIQSALDQREKELAEAHKHLHLFRKVFDPEAETGSPRESPRPDMTKHVDLAKRCEAAEQGLRVATEKATRLESQVTELRTRHSDELSELDARHSSSRRNLLEELSQSQVNARQQSPIPFRATKDLNTKKLASTPLNQRHISLNTDDSARSDRTMDTTIFNTKMDQAAEIELLQNQLQMSEMQNKHLQNRLDNISPSKIAQGDESPTSRRMQKLARENTRLHSMLDDSAKKVSALENSLRTGQLSLKEVQTKSHEELYDLLNSTEQGRRKVVQNHNHAVAELAEAKTSFDELRTSKASIEVELRDARSELKDLQYEREQEATSHAQILQEFADMQVRLDAETSKLLDVQSSLAMYKSRADEYLAKLEHAEITVLKATRAEQFAKSQSKDAEEQCAIVMAERKTMESNVEDLQRALQRYEERIEDISSDLESALQAKKRLQNELEDYRSQRAMDIEDKESSMEQTRRKYQGELTSAGAELEMARENVIAAREDNSRLRDEIEELRGKWDDEVLNSSTWAKEKSRLELTLQDLVQSRDEATSAHNDAQGKVVELLSQVRNLRSNVDEVAGERDQLAREKKSLEARLAGASEKLEDLTRSKSPSMRNAAATDREVLELKASLAKQEDITAAAVGKMRRADALAQETQKDIGVERETNHKLHKDKAALEKQVKDLQLRLVDLETKGYSPASQDVRFLNGRVQELERSLEAAESASASTARSTRAVDRQIADLKAQVERGDKRNGALEDDVAKARDRLQNLLVTIDELQSSESGAQLAAKRAERELREERDTRMRLEREMEGWKGLRMEKGSFRGGLSGVFGSEAGDAVRSRRGSYLGSVAGELPLPHRQLRKISGQSFL